MITNNSTSRQRVRRLREAGLKATSARLAVLAALEDARVHPTAEALFGIARTSCPSVSLSTVYDTVRAFLRVGLCRRVPGDKLRVDGRMEEHDHAVCRGCGRIFDVPRRLPLPEIPARLPSGLAVEAVRIEYEVVCAPCRAGRLSATRTKER